MMMLGLVVLSVPFYLAKQTQLIAMLFVGGFVGVVEIDGEKLDKRMGLSMPTAAALYDLGILFLLFMAGMEVDLQAVMKGWKLILIHGIGHLGLNFGVFVGIASAAFKDDPEITPIGIIYFAICCTLSSAIMVISCLKKRGELEGMHGQITLGIMVMGDIGGVLAIAVMEAFDRRPGAAQVNIPKKIGFLVMWVAILLVFLVVLRKFVLEKLFLFFAASAEMLFIVTFAYSLGMAAFFGHFLPGWIIGGFNQELSIFFAGVSVASLPYRVQIETFVEPIKAFGVVLFFFILGINLPLEPIEDLVAPLGWGFGIALLTGTHFQKSVHSSFCIECSKH
jgi:Kef-type K+ transport system membrane component KefB